ncbi:DUF7144 family membrane protein [Nocardiopsis ansamitocini]|uniref:DUF7144 domain-containing protein n=1 Tax=Nocardiopsis ansamitocini TaxID=1670832 RepID=A0A9W6PB13_9ACTN|nr:hypothetical protein [Nocardiopsis ansamitocini]GLU50263.1 hypothetical protein Nans01_46140 [Nocardiopsis ansamitocini]
MNQGSRVTRSAGTSGWAVFAATMILLVGVINVIQGIIAMFMPDYYLSAAGGLFFFDFTLWGIGLAIWGVIMVLAGLAIASGRMWARAFGVVLAAINALAQLVFLEAHPMWSLVVIAIDLLIIYGLTAGWPTITATDERDVSYRSGHDDATGYAPRDATGYGPRDAVEPDATHSTHTGHRNPQEGSSTHRRTMPQ